MTLTCVNGYDISKYVENTINFDQAINDQIPKADFDVVDDGCLLTFDWAMEVILWDENTSSIPAHNLVPMPNVTPTWSLNSSPLSGLFSGFPGLTPVMTFSNTTYSGGNNWGLATASSPTGYIHPGQSYMLSMYLTIPTPLVNAQAMLKLDFFDLNNNIIGAGSVQITLNSTTANARQRVSVQGVAPAGAALVKGSFGGTASVSGTNSGSITFDTPQLEPMYFSDTSVDWNISYPTPNCNYYQVDCAQMPDGTTSRACRMFSGYIDDFEVDYDGPNRKWHISCAGPGAQLENGNINAVFTGQTDSTILTTLVNSYFSGQLSVVAPNSSSAAPIQTGIVEDNITYNDNSLREVLNGFTDKSGFVAFIDMYYALRYQPEFYNVASFTLSETPDESSSFPYSVYNYKKDGTQVKRRIKITGGKGIATAFKQFSGNGSTKIFTLDYTPYSMNSLVSAGVTQRVGIKGRDGFTGQYDVLMDKIAKTIEFNVAPPSGTNNITAVHGYEAPMSTQAIMQGSGLPSLPAYAIPLFDAKVNDTNINSLVSATQRGLAEIAKSGNPREILKATSEQFAPAGVAVYITHTRSGIINKPYVIQSVKGRCLGNGINEYDYVLGSFNPSIIDHLRNANKAMNRSTTVSGVTAPQQIDVVAIEIIAYRDSISATPVASYSTSVYGTAHYGTSAYGGSTGVYGTARYGQSTVYG
jgi:hypothetical protein